MYSRLYSYVIEVINLTYIHFTDEQKQLAASVDLEAFLRSRGERLISSGRDKRLASDHSVTIRGNEWYDHAEEKKAARRSALSSGITASAMPMPCPHCSVTNWVLLILRHLEKQVEVKSFALPPASKNMHRVFAYLCKTRSIDRDVVSAFAKAHLVYEDAEYHNAVFVGIGGDGTPRHAHKRSTNSEGKSFRQNVEGSDPKHSFNYTGTDGSLYVFEAPIDLLSYISLYPSDWQAHSYVACCGTSIQSVLEQPAVRTSTACTSVWITILPGKKPHSAWRLNYLNEGYMLEIVVPTLKDWNDDLRKEAQEWTQTSGLLLIVAGLGFAVIGGLAMLSSNYTLGNIKSKTVGDGQHGTARWATEREIRKTFALVPFEVASWREGKNLPTEQGLVLGSRGKKGKVAALVDSDDVHCLMIGASGVGKTAYFLYPNLEYACASGMSFFCERYQRRPCA